MTLERSSGEQLAKFVESLAQFHEDLSTLLGAADSLATRGALEVMTREVGSVCWAFGSTGIDKPDQWTPSEVFRWYRAKADPSRLAYVAVLLRDRNKEFPLGLPEPLITAGWFQFPQPTIPTTAIHWYVRWHAYLRQRKDDGTWTTQTPNDLEKSDIEQHKYAWSRVETLAHPLAAVVDTTALGNLIVTPLLERVTPAGTTGKGID